MATLWEIGDDIRALDDLLEELGGDVTDPQVAAAWAALAADLASDESRKLDGYVNWIRRLEMEAMAARAEADRYLQKARKRDNRIAWIKANLQAHLESTARARIETETHRVISIRGDGGAVPVKLSETLDPAALPDEFAVVRRTPDIEAIRAALADGRELPFATLGERGTHLRIT
jgi:hypothetical protein